MVGIAVGVKAGVLATVDVGAAVGNTTTVLVAATVAVGGAASSMGVASARWKVIGSTYRDVKFSRPTLLHDCPTLIHTEKDAQGDIPLLSVTLYRAGAPGRRA